MTLEKLARKYDLYMDLWEAAKERGDEENAKKWVEKAADVAWEYQITKEELNF